MVTTFVDHSKIVMSLIENEKKEGKKKKKKERKEKRREKEKELH